MPILLMHHALGRYWRHSSIASVLRLALTPPHKLRDTNKLRVSIAHDATDSPSTYCHHQGDSRHIVTDPCLVRFGRRVRRLRLDRGLSQEALGALAALDRTYIGGIERGQRNIGLINVVKIAQALHVSPSCLLEDVFSADEICLKTDQDVVSD